MPPGLPPARQHTRGRLSQPLQHLQAKHTRNASAQTPSVLLGMAQWDTRWGGSVEGGERLGRALGHLRFSGVYKSLRLRERAVSWPRNSIVAVCQALLSPAPEPREKRRRQTASLLEPGGGQAWTGGREARGICHMCFPRAALNSLTL